MMISFLKGDKVGPETDYRDALPVNMTGIPSNVLGGQGYMLQTPGLKTFANGRGVDRGGIWNERLIAHYRVSGDSLVSVDEFGSVTNLGSVGGTKTASMPYSFNTQGIVSGGRFYLYDDTNGLVEVIDPDLGDPIDGVWINGYYFFTDGPFLYHTDLADETAIDPLKFATAEFSPDPTLGVAKTTDDKVIVFGRYSIEYFINDASPNFAFQRLGTRALKIGIVGTHCKVEIQESFFILGGRKSEDIAVHSIGMQSVLKVSSREVDKLIGKYSEAQLKDVVLETRTEDDVIALIIHLPNETLLYNLTLAKSVGSAAAWTILKSGTEAATWRGIHGIFEPRKGQFVYGDKTTSQIGSLDATEATTYGEIAEWILYTPFMKLEGASVDSLEVETIPGFTGEKDATVAISLTYDGNSYSNEWFSLYGNPSDYINRFIINRLGYVRNWFGIRLRGATRSRMAFGVANIEVG